MIIDITIVTITRMVCKSYNNNCVISTTVGFSWRDCRYIPRAILASYDSSDVDAVSEVLQGWSLAEVDAVTM